MDAADSSIMEIFSSLLGLNWSKLIRLGSTMVFVSIENCLWWRQANYSRDVHIQGLCYCLRWASQCSLIWNVNEGVLRTAEVSMRINRSDYGNGICYKSGLWFHPKVVLEKYLPPPLSLPQSQLFLSHQRIRGCSLWALLNSKGQRF